MKKMVGICLDESEIARVAELADSLDLSRARVFAALVHLGFTAFAKDEMAIRRAVPRLRTTGRKPKEEASK